MTNDIWEHTKLEEKKAQLRIKWTQAKKKEDTAMMSVIERQVKALERGAGK